MKKIKLSLILLSLLLLCSCGKKISNSEIASSTEQSTEVLSVSVEESCDFTESTVSDTTISSAANSSNYKDYTKGNPEKTGSGELSQSILEQQENTISTDSGDNQPTVNNAIISVNCLNAVNYGIRNNPSFAGVIPENGIILSDTSIEFSDGDSVMKVLKNALKKNGVTYQITSGGYVRSIGGLSEFDCGTGSGWLYRVNGVYPDVSCKSYTLSSGDKIEFVYTCKNGDT